MITIARSGPRPQFMPTVAVDDVTGTVGVMYYDGRWDPSLARVANSFSASIDGGQTFSASTFLNTPRTAIDEITGKVITIEPVPGNQAQANATFGWTTFDQSLHRAYQAGLVTEANERSVLGAEIGQRHLSVAGDGDLSVPSRDERVVEEVHVVAFPADRDGVAPGAVDHTDLAAPQPLDQLHLRGSLGTGVEVRPLGVRLGTEIGRRGLDLEQLLALPAVSAEQRNLDT